MTGLIQRDNAHREIDLARPDQRSQTFECWNDLFRTRSRLPSKITDESSPMKMRGHCLNFSVAADTIDAALVMEFTKNRPTVKAGLMTPTEEIW